VSVEGRIETIDFQEIFCLTNTFGLDWQNSTAYSTNDLLLKQTVR